MFPGINAPPHIKQYLFLHLQRVALRIELRAVHRIENHFQIPRVFHDRAPCRRLKALFILGENRISHRFFEDDFDAFDAVGFGNLKKMYRSIQSKCGTYFLQRRM
jgi:hypothetical protein